MASSDNYTFNNIDCSPWTLQLEFLHKLHAIHLSRLVSLHVHRKKPLFQSVVIPLLFSLSYPPAGYLEATFSVFPTTARPTKNAPLHLARRLESHRDSRFSMAAAFRVECDDFRVRVGKHVAQKLLEDVPETTSTVWWGIGLISVTLLWPSAYKNERKSDPRAGLQVVAGGQRCWGTCSWGS